MTRLLQLLICVVFYSSIASAAEVSLVSGLFQREKSKLNGSNAGGSSSIELGGRYADELTTQQMWYVEAKVLLKSYDSSAGRSAPDNYTGLTARGGIRYLFPEFSEKIIPYIAAAGGYESNKTVTESLATTEEVEISGLTYSGILGMNFNMDRDFFFALESELFRSNLFVTEKTETTTYGPPVTTSKAETTRTDLYARGHGPLLVSQLILGMRF